MKGHAKFELGKPFPVPGAIPQREAAYLELWGGGPVVIIQMPGLRREEKQAFKKTFKRYTYLETDTNPPLAVWIFDFPKPHGPIDMSFDGGRVGRGFVEDYLDTKEGVKNGITFYLLDRETLKAMKFVGLSPEAVKLFHATIRKQIKLDYTEQEYEMALAVTFTRTSEELIKMGRTFKHSKRR